MASSSPESITAVLGIWLTTKRLLICWPVTLVSDFSLYGGLLSRAACSPTRCCRSSSSPSPFTAGGTGGAACARKAKVRVVPLMRSSLIAALVLGIPGSFVLGTLARHLHAALPYLDAVLTSYSLSPVGGGRASTSPTGGSGSSWISSTSASTSTRISGPRRCSTRAS